MSAFLQGEQIFLRGISTSDANERYVGWLSDSQTTQGLASGKFPTSVEQLRQYIERILNDPNAVMFAICDGISGDHIGNVKLDCFDWVGRTCELGLLIGDKNSWGKGIGTEVCSLVTRYAFEQLNMRKVSLTVYSNNPKAIRLYEKIGFKQEGCLEKHIYEGGEFHDKLWMSLFNTAAI